MTNHSDFSEGKDQSAEGFGAEDFTDDDFENFETGSAFSLGGAWEMACRMRQRTEDAFLRAMPEEVSQHLINSQREAVKAFVRLGERAIERLDASERRAQELHDRPASAPGGKSCDPI